MVRLNKTETVRRGGQSHVKVGTSEQDRGS